MNIMSPFASECYKTLADFSHADLKAFPSTAEVSKYFSEDAEFYRKGGSQPFDKTTFERVFAVFCEQQVAQYGAPQKVKFGKSPESENAYTWKFSGDQYRVGFGENRIDGGWFHVKARYTISMKQDILGNVKICKIQEISTLVVSKETSEELATSPLFGSELHLIV